MKIIELEKRVNEIIKEQELDKETLRYSLTTDRVESIINNLLGESKDKIISNTYGEKGHIILKVRNCYFGEIDVKIKRKNNGYAGGIFGYQSYGITGVEISKNYDSIEEFIEKEEQRKVQSDNRALMDYEELIEKIEGYGISKEQFKELIHGYDCLSYGYKKRFNEEEGWERWI